MQFLKSVEEKLSRLKDLERQIQDPNVAKDPNQLRDLGRELHELQRIRELHESYMDIEKGIIDARHLADDESQDPEMRRMAGSEFTQLEERRHSVLRELEDLFIKKDPLLSKNAIVEIRAGTGGAEASLFAGDIFRMYAHYAQNHGFKVEILSQAETEAGGIREVIFSVTGKGVFGRFKYESGVHRVQRVPATEASGRIHTSAVTVAVLPEAEDIEIDIRPDELKVDVFRSGGPGGQSVNTTDSAVRVTHVPTGLVVKCQDEKSQLKNKMKAMKILRARLFDFYQTESNKKMASQRKKQVGSGDRSEKIRTYNFPERRVTDHRVGLTIHNLNAVLDGDLDSFVDRLFEEEQEIE